MKNKMIIEIIFGFIMLVGIVVTCIYGLNFGLEYGKHKEVDIYIGQEFKNQDIYEIVIQVLGNQSIAVQKVELYEDMVAISVKDITDEQLSNLNTKINEKYGIENKIEQITVTEVPNVRGRDLIKPYIIPGVISFVITIIFFIIYNSIYSHKGRDINVVKVVFKSIISIVVVQVLYLSLLAITRVPINKLTIPISIVLYTITTIAIIMKLEKKYSKVEK